MTKLHLHIGPHKTGTTSIQKFLGANADRALAEDVYHYPASVHLKNVVSLHRPFLVDDASSYDPSVWGEIVNELQRSPATGIVSAEGLSLLNDQQIAILREALVGMDTSVTVTVRPQASWLHSMFIQQLKQGKAPRTFAAHVSHSLDADDGNMFRLAERWERIFQPDSMSILPLVDPADTRPLESRFLGTLMGEVPEWVEEADTERANPAPTPRELALLRHLADSLPGNIDWQTFNGVYFPAVRAFAHRKRWDKTVKANFLTPNLIRRIEAHFDDSNSRLCDRYFAGDRSAMRQAAPPDFLTDLDDELGQLSAIDLSAFSIHLIERIRNGKLPVDVL